MNTGIVSSRYAKALLRLVTETGRGMPVSTQVRALLKNPDCVPGKLEPELEKLAVLLEQNGRMSYVKFVLRSFLSQYYKQEGMVEASLVTAVPSPELEGRIRKIIKDKYGLEAVLDVSVDPSIEGGFVLTVDDDKLDASTKRQLEIVRRQLIEKNTRIV